MKLFILSLVLALSSCGQSTSRHHEKQRTPSDIKISALDLENNNIKMRFEYRSYVEKKLENVSCKIDFNKQSSINIDQLYPLELGAFSTETLNFQVANINPNNHLTNLLTINYDIDCEMVYDKGKEYVSASSVLHLVPSEKFLYR